MNAQRELALRAALVRDLGACGRNHAERVTRSTTKHKRGMRQCVMNLSVSFRSV